MTDPRINVAVVIDAQNTIKTARRALGLSQKWTIDPLAIGTALAAAQGRGVAGHLVRVCVCMGCPPAGSHTHPSRNDVMAQIARWHSAPVHVRALPMGVGSRPAKGPAEAKEIGVDVDAAVEVLYLATSGTVGVVVLVSGDADLAPAVEWAHRNVDEIVIETAGFSPKGLHLQHEIRAQCPHTVLNESVLAEVPRGC